MKNFFIIILIICNYINIKAQTLNADFYVTSTSGCSPFVVKFYNNSTPVTGVSYLWNFGNGAVSQVDEPTITFNEAGQYNVSLIIFYDSNSDTLLLYNYITVYENPQPNFSITSSQFGCVPYSVSFHDNTTLGNVPIVLWNWDFGDGQISNLQTPTHIYDYQNIFDVSFYVIDYNGCKNTITKQQFIQTSQPNANFNATDTVNCNGSLLTNFQNTSTGFPTINYLWNFGDGNSSTQKNPTHFYNTNGVYNVKLNITDNYNCKDSLIKYNYIYVDDIQANFISSKDTACIYETVNFTNLTNLANSYFWDFGDSVTSTLQNLNHTFKNYSNYDVKLIAYYKAGCSDTIVHRINIEKVVADFSVSTHYSCEIPLTVNFFDNSINAVQWTWYFGINSTSNLQNPSVTYNVSGYFKNSLTVSSKHGCNDTKVLDSNIIIIKPKAYFIPNSFYNPLALRGCIPLTVNFTDQTIYNNKYDSIISWQWTFGNGEISALQNPTIVYNELNEFNIKLKISTAKNCESEYTTIAKTGTPQHANFYSNAKDTICASEKVNFFDISTDASKIDGWNWVFSDGTNSSNQNPLNQFIDTGYVDVRFMVFNNGCPDDTLVENYVYIKGPYAEISFSTNCDNSLKAIFNSNQIDAQKIYWNFGDGSPIDSVNFNPIHQYAQNGYFDVNLMLSNQKNNCSFDTIKTIKLYDLKAIIKTDTTLGCKNLLVKLDPNSSQDYSNYNYTTGFFYWNFGDNTNSNITNGITYHNFTEKGVHNVKLKVQDANGCLDSATKQIKIYNPEPDFFASNFTDCMPMSVDFNNVTLSDTITNIWKWKFGDNQISNQQNPVHVYNNFGVFSVKLLTENILGCKDSILKINYIEALKPVPNITLSDRTICKFDTVLFSNNSHDSIIFYKWNFGDSNFSNLKNPYHSFTDSGYYNLSLYVVDEQGCDSMITYQNYIHVQSPSTPDFIADTTTSKCYPLVVNFTDVSNNKNVNQWFWNFGDNFSTSNIQNATHTYSFPNDFDVTLQNTTTYGCKSEIIKPKFISVKGAFAEIIAPDTVCKNHEINLIAANLKNIYSLIWILGDGNVAYKDTVYHKYKLTGYVTPLLIALSDTNGTCNKYYDASIYIQQLAADFSFADDINSGCIPFYVGVNNNSQNYSSLQWTFDDNFTSNYEYCEFLYDKPGNFNVKLISYDDFGCTDTISKPIQVFPIPTVTITNDTLICRAENLKLAASGGNQYFWYPNLYLNNNLSQTPIATPDSTIRYFVKVTDKNLCVDTANILVIIQQEPEIYLKDTSIIIGESFNLNVNTYDVATYVWTPDYNISCNNCSYLTFNPLESTTYNLSVTDTMNCFLKNFEFLVDVIPKYSVDVPTAFTPNGDGINDVIFVDGWGIEQLIEFKIFNRFGELIFSTNDINKGWDGNYKNKLQNIESYTYFIKVKTYENQTLTKTGSIKLLK